LNLSRKSPIQKCVGIPIFVPYLAAFLMSLFMCVCLHLFIRGRRIRKAQKSPLPLKKPLMTAGNCISIIRNQMAQVQTYPHPSAHGKQNAEFLSDLLMEARTFHPSSKTQLEAFSSRIREVYQDEGLFLMALMDLHKWVNSHQTSEIS